MCLKFESTKQRELLLEEDKSYLKKQFEEANDRKSELEKINNDLLDRNLRLQAAREELIEKYLIDADQVGGLGVYIIRFRFTGCVFTVERWMQCCIPFSHEIFNSNSLLTTICTKLIKTDTMTASYDFLLQNFSVYN